MRGILVRLIFIGIFISLFATAESQYFRRQSYWKHDRAEIFGGAGITNFLGELGGRDQIGSDFIWDLELQETNPALTIGYRYRISRGTGVRSTFTYALLTGDDQLTMERFRSNRNLHFKTNIFELGITFDFEIYEFRPGHRYSLGVKGVGSRYGAVIFGIAGVSGFHFNPKANYEGQWVELQPLGTEGQNFEGTPDPYSRISVAFPVGLGYKKRINSVTGISIELTHRFTLTDYIDDVSTSYYDNQEILSTQGPMAAFLADPSLGYYIDPETGTQVPEEMSAPGAQRGDESDRDGYMFLTVNMYRKLKKNNFRRSKRVIRRSGKKIVF